MNNKALDVVGFEKANDQHTGNGEISPTTTKRTHFDQVAAGVCPHCQGRLGDEINGSGVGVTRICETCGHKWYLNTKIKTCKCLTCGTRKRSAEKRIAKGEANVLDVAHTGDYNRPVKAGVAELADAADLKSAGAILVGSSPTPGISWRLDMPWLMVLLGYLLGAIPTAYIAGRLFQGSDIRKMGDGNVGAANAFRQLGAKMGAAVGIIDAGKGMLAILIAQATNQPQIAVLFSGAAAVIGHNWPVFLSFRGGRGESTTVGVLLSVVTQPMLLVAAPAIFVLIIKRNVTLASAFLFIPLPLVCWWLGVSGNLVAYSIGLPCLVGFTHFIKTRRMKHQPS